MEKKIITISRQHGSGGRTVGHQIAEKLGIPFYDKELVEHIAVESGFAPKFVEENGEHAPGKNSFAYAFAPMGVPGVMNGLSTSDYLWNAQCKVIMDLADKGPCVIVGRNADYILKDRDDVLNVFVYADEDFRARRIVELYGENDKNPISRVRERDKRRKVNYEHYTGRTWGRADNYDVCLKSSLLGIDKCSEIILAILEDSKK